MERNSGNIQSSEGKGEFYVGPDGKLIPVPVAEAEESVVPVTAAGNPYHSSANGRFVSGPGGKIYSKDARGQLSEVAGTKGKGLKVIGGELHQKESGRGGSYIPITGPKSQAVKNAKTRADVLYNRQVALDAGIAAAVKGRVIPEHKYGGTFEWSPDGGLSSDRGIHGYVESVPGKGTAGSYKATVGYEFSGKEYTKTFDAAKVKDAVAWTEREAGDGLTRIINGEGSKDW